MVPRSGHILSSRFAGFFVVVGRVSYSGEFHLRPPSFSLIQRSRSSSSLKSLVIAKRLGSGEEGDGVVSNCQRHRYNHSSPMANRKSRSRPIRVEGVFLSLSLPSFSLSKKGTVLTPSQFPIDKQHQCCLCCQRELIIFHIDVEYSRRRCRRSLPILLVPYVALLDAVSDTNTSI